MQPCPVIKHQTQKHNSPRTKVPVTAGSKGGGGDTGGAGGGGRAGGGGGAGGATDCALARTFQKVAPSPASEQGAGGEIRRCGL